MVLMQLASDRLLLPLCQHRQQEERSTEDRERHTGKTYGGCRGEEEGGRERGGGSEGLRKGEGIQKRELVKAKKREKGQDIAWGEERGRILKRVKRAAAKKQESKAAGEEKKEQKYLH